LQGPKGFESWFERATGNSPYAYQRKLAESTATPGVLAVPTGCGKTQAVLGAWIYQRERGVGPRRLVYALPMRTLVEQTRDVALEMRERLGIAPGTMPIHVLIGGEEPREGDWRLYPEQGQILIGTIDMLLSRALNRGYGEGRFFWPISFGLLNSDCRWVFDEVQLMGPARTTSAQLDGLRATLGTALPCESIWVSATVDPALLQTVDRPDVGATMGLTDADRETHLKQRLGAAKTLEREDLGPVEPKSRPRAIAEIAAARHQRGTLTLVVLNTVDAAQQVFAALGRELSGDDAPEAVLLHSRFRPGDREAQMATVREEPGEEGTIMVSTQVIEAGVDLSARTLLTETAPFSSIVQRLGRCNRAGKDNDEARVVWLDNGPTEDGKAGLKAAAPYLPADLARSREELLGRVGESLSPERLEGITVAETPDDPAILRRRDLLDLFDTSPDLSGTNIDIAPYIREDDERTVLVCFRQIGKDGKPEPDHLPDRTEIVQVPLASLGDRPCWLADHVSGIWERRRGKRAPPGATVVLDAAEGGYTPELGWDGKSKQPVEVITAPDSRNPVVGFDFEEPSARPEQLLPHLKAVQRETEEIAAELGLEPWAKTLTAAAALHDLGKAHPAFQATLREAMERSGIEAGNGEGVEDGTIWAKSGTRGARHKKRPHLRHELASALALRGLDGTLELPQPDLTAYLVAAHHGRVRLSIRPAPGETQTDAGDEKRFALGIVDGDPLPAIETPLGTIPPTRLDLGCMKLGGDEDSWTWTALSLRDSPELGPFRLGFLEAVLRMADWRGSADG
jgi:CRISPR-associated endonuclease/helicase Cas3